MTPAAGPSGGEPGAGTAAYEGLRAWATGQPLSGPRPPGLALLLRFGVPAWLAAAPARRPPARATPLGAAHGPAAGPAGDVVAGLTLVLAAMVAACHPGPPEGRP
jgi:hypothetical protein